jgi:hypothetical protein
LVGKFSPIILPFSDRGLSRRLTWGASGDEWGIKSGVSTISSVGCSALGGIPPAPQTEEEEEEEEEG